MWKNRVKLEKVNKALSSLRRAKLISDTQSNKLYTECRNSEDDMTIRKLIVAAADRLRWIPDIDATDGQGKKAIAYFKFTAPTNNPIWVIEYTKKNPSADYEEVENTVCIFEKGVKKVLNPNTIINLGYELEFSFQPLPLTLV